MPNIYLYHIFQGVFDNAFMWLRDSGISEGLTRDAVRLAAMSEGEANYKRVRSNQPLNLMHLMTSFMLFGGGIVIALIAFCSELILGKCTKKDSNRGNQLRRTRRLRRTRPITTVLRTKPVTPFSFE